MARDECNGKKEERQAHRDGGAENKDESKSGDESESSDENENSDTQGEQEDNQVNWDQVWPGTREKTRKRSIRHTTV